MVLTDRQRPSLRDAVGQVAKRRLTTLYNRQNAQSAAGRAPAHVVARSLRSRGRNANIRSQPRSNMGVPKGVMTTTPDWSQTPASSNIIAPRGFGYYDAFATDPFSAGTSMSIGPATPIVGSTLIQGTALQTAPPDTCTTTTGDVLEAGFKLLIVAPSRSEDQAMSYVPQKDTNGVYEPAYGYIPTKYKSPPFQQNPPDNAIPTRCSLRIRNLTPSLMVGGVVRVLRLTTGTTLSDTSVAVNGTSWSNNEDLCRFAEEVRNHPRSRTYTGHDLLESHQVNCTVVDQSKACDFQDFNTIYHTDDFAWTGASAGGAGWPQPVAPDFNTYTLSVFTIDLHNPTMTPIAILFEPFGVSSTDLGFRGNQYEVTVRSQFLGHYNQGSILAGLTINPRADQALMNKHRNVEEAKGSSLWQTGLQLAAGPMGMAAMKGGMAAYRTLFGGGGGPMAYGHPPV